MTRDPGASPPRTIRDDSHDPRRRPLGLVYGAGAILLGVGGFLLLPWGVIMLWCAIATGGVALAYLALGPGTFGKRNGRLRVLPWTLFGPWIGAMHFWRTLRRRTPGYNQVLPNLWIGRQPTLHEAAALVENGVTAVIDLTCEHTEPAPLRNGRYLNLQTLDLTTPTIDTVEAGARFAADEMRRGVVYVHCGDGMRRAAITTAGALLANDPGLDANSACARVREARPIVRLRPTDLDVLHRLRERLAAPSDPSSSTRSHQEVQS